MTGTDRKVDTPTARGDSRPVRRFELIDRFGMLRGRFSTIAEAGQVAARIWPDQEQDEDRSGKGWDIQVADAAS